MLMACSMRSPDSVKVTGNGTERIGEDRLAAFINFRTFQNEDKTWGFTIFINNAPYRNYKTIPFKKAEWSILSGNDAGKVAAIFVNMIKNGDQAPKLTENIMDSLGIKLVKITEQPPT